MKKKYTFYCRRVLEGHITVETDDPKGFANDLFANGYGNEIPWEVVEEDVVDSEEE